MFLEHVPCAWSLFNVPGACPACLEHVQRFLEHVQRAWSFSDVPGAARAFLKQTQFDRNSLVQHH
jgi:hypothetical protein